MIESPGNLSGEHALAFAQRLADAARPLALRHFRTPLNIVRKADSSPVTVADREIETRLRHIIKEEYPDHGVVGEEYGGAPGMRYTWILDPIDGTRSFIIGNPLFGTLIGLLEDHRPFIGVIDCPALGERWWGDGTYALYYDGVKERAAMVSHCRSIEEARLYVSHLEYPGPEKKGLEEQQAIGVLNAQVSISRPVCDCYAYGLLASGHCDLVIETGLEVVDYLPLVPVVEGAGGLITDWKGNSLDCGSDGRVVAAASKELSKAAVEILNHA